MKHVPDETWATVVADMYFRKYPERGFGELEETALAVVKAMREGRKHMPGKGYGMLMQETFQDLAKNGYMAPFGKEGDGSGQGE